MGEVPSIFPINLSRPRNVVFASEGLDSSIEDIVKGMGIPEVGVADKKLIASMKSSFSKRLNFDRGPSESMVKAMESGNTTELTRSIGKRMLDRTENETYYASEKRVPLY